MANGLVCYVSMPFGTKGDGLGGGIDFDLIYRSLIAPAVSAVGLSSMRADQLQSVGSLDRSILEQIVRAPLAIFDVTAANPNVLYELGVRHAVQPRGTLVIGANRTAIPSQLQRFRFVSYELNSAGRPEHVDAFQREFSRVAQSILESTAVDSPVYTLLPQLRPGALEDISAEVAGAAANTEQLKRLIVAARRLGTDELREVQEELGDPSLA